MIVLATELLLVRHAPSHPAGKLYGRTDVAADVSDVAAMAALRQAAGPVDGWVSSPALRCRQTLAGIWGEATAATEDPRLWEQDFGDWDGLSHAEVPDIGALAPARLAAHRPPGGESFHDVCQRVQPALLEWIGHSDGGRLAIVAHAGVVRAALALALKGTESDAPAMALSFEVAPLSLTIVRVHAPEVMSIARTNWRAPCVAPVTKGRVGA